MSNPAESRPILNGMPPIHPGELLAEILGDLKMSQAEFARVIGVSPMRISHVVRGERPVTAELALRFGRAFDQSPQMWSSWQADYDLKIAQSQLGSDLDEIPRLAA
jgi:addiction module HigA family antidote